MSCDVRNLPKLRKHKHTLEPLWADDTGRNSNSGKYSGTFVGYFSQIILDFGKTTQAELDVIQNSLEVPIIEDLTYKSKNGGTWDTEDFYGTAIIGELDNWNKKYKPFTITLTGVERKK